MITRRSLLTIAVCAPLANAAGRGTVVPSALHPYEDLATELPVTRLTDPNFTSVLPRTAGSPIARRGGFLLYASDADGSMQAYRMDLKKGESRQVTEATQLDPHSLVMVSESGFFYVDGPRLMNASFSTGRALQVYRASEGFELASEFHVSSDGAYAAVVERKGQTHRLRLVNKAVAATLAESDHEILALLVRPKRASVLYRSPDGLHLANFDGKQSYRLRTLKGSVAQAQWTPDGRSVFYLHVPEETGRLRTLREFVPDTNEDKAVADTSQFAAFARNADASVFVGASASKASPYVLLLARAVKRELTLCEHRASDPAMVNPQFSPNSQQVFFASDLHGKPAIYRVDVGKLVADTADSEALYK